jgi:rubrerythrin
MSDIGRETLEMQRMVEFEAQQRRQQSQRSPSPARQNTLDLEERFRRAEENERRRLGQSGPSPVTAGRYQRAEDNERRTMAGGSERQSTRQPLNRSNARPLDIQERYRSPEELERQRAEEARQADAETAALLARQFEEEDARIQREHSELMSSAQKTFECSICMDEHVEEDLAAVDMCGHKFGRECLKDFIASKVDQRSYPIVCPICIAEQNRDGGRDRIGSECLILQQLP